MTLFKCDNAFRGQVNGVRWILTRVYLNLVITTEPVMTSSLAIRVRASAATLETTVPPSVCAADLFGRRRNIFQHETNLIFAMSCANSFSLHFSRFSFLLIFAFFSGMSALV